MTSASHEVTCPECRGIMVNALPVPQQSRSIMYECSVNKGHFLYIDP